jgi:hypothetical protein
MMQNREWFTFGDAVTDYGLESSLVLQWVEEGEIRAEHPGTRTMRIHIRDLEDKIQTLSQ